MKFITEYLVNNHVKPVSQISFAASENELTDGSYYKVAVRGGDIWLGKYKSMDDRGNICNYYVILIQDADDSNPYTGKLFTDLTEDHYIPGKEYIDEYITEVTKEDISIIETVEEYLKDPQYGRGPHIQIINGKAQI